MQTGRALRQPERCIRPCGAQNAQCLGCAGEQKPLCRCTRRAPGQAPHARRSPSRQRACPPSAPVPAPPPARTAPAPAAHPLHSRPPGRPPCSRAHRPISYARLQTLHPSVSAPLCFRFCFFQYTRKCPFRPNLREIVYFTIKSIYNVKRTRRIFTR